MPEELDTKPKEQEVVSDAETFTPAQTASDTFAAQYLDDLFKRVKADGSAKPGGEAGEAKPAGADAKPGDPKPGEGKPGNYDYHPGADSKPGAVKPGDSQPGEAKPAGDDKFDFHQGKTASQDLQALFSKVKEGEAVPTASQVEKFDAGAVNLRVLKVGDTQTGQIVDANGKTTTRLDDKVSLEYDPASGKYTKIEKVDGQDKRTEVDPNTSTEKFGPEGKTLKQLINDGVSKETGTNPASEKTTYLDGKVTSKFTEAKPGEVSERSTYPPNYRHEKPEDKGLRQTEKVLATPPGDKTENSAREVKTFDNRKETSFEKGDITKVTAFKDAEKGKPAVVTDYRKVGEGADAKYMGPDGAKSVEKYKNTDNDPKAIKEVAKFDGKPDKITFQNGTITERPTNGDIRTPVGQGDRTGVIDVNKETGMPTQMQIGDREYKVTYGPDGKIKSMTVEAKGDPPGKLELERDANGEMKVKTATGRFEPDKQTGKINLEGLPIQTKDGKVVGDLHLNKQGDIRYKTGEGSERTEVIRRANGDTENLDFKNWTKKITGPDGKVKSDQAWDGFEWRNYKQSQDGKRIDFQPQDPKKPSFIERDTSGTPPGDKTVIGYADKSKVVADWQKGTQTEVSADGKTQTVRHYDGNTYREGTEKDASKEIDPRTGQALGKAGDKLVEFKDGQPKKALLRPDGTTVAIYERPGERQPTIVEKGKNGQVSEVSGPNGVFKFEHDGDGDITRMSEYSADGKTFKNSYKRSGQEQDPGMQQWLGRDGADKVRQPGDKPPRDPFNPKSFNTWVPVDEAGKPLPQVDQDGKAIPGRESKTMNYHTTADGTVRQETPGKDGQPPTIEMRSPRGERYKETADSKITDRGFNLTETLDKKTGELSLEINRNGEKIKINTKDGGYRVLPEDGTVVQQAKDGKSIKYFLPDGSQASFKVEEGGKQTPTELKVAKNDPNKPGEYETLKPGTPPVKTLEYTPEGRFKATITDGSGKDVNTVYDLKGRTKSEQKEGDKFARAYSMDTGKFTGINSPDGKPMLTIGADGKARTPNGVVLDSKDFKFGPDDISKDAEGNAIIKSAKADSKDQYLLKPDGRVVESKAGKDDKTIFPNKVEATYNSDGTVKSVKIGTNEYTPVLDADKNIVALKPAQPAGSPEIKAIPQGMKFKLDDKGRITNESKEGETNVLTEWKPNQDPKQNAYSVEKTWKTADGKDASFKYTADADGKISRLNLPPNRNELVIDRLKNNPAYKDKPNDNPYKDINASLSPDGVVTINLDANNKVVVNKDGSQEQSIKKDGKELVLYRDRDGKLAPTDAQAKSLGELLESDLSKDENKTKLLNELLRRFDYSDARTAQKDVKDFLDALNKKIAPASVQIEPATAASPKPTLVVKSKAGQPVRIPLG